MKRRITQLFSCGVLLITLGVFASSTIATPRAMIINDVRFYGIVTAQRSAWVYVGGKEVEVRPGDRFPFDDYDHLHGTAFSIIDVEASITNNKQTLQIDAEVQLSIIPKTAPLVTFPELPGAANWPEIEKHAAWAAPLLVLKRRIPVLAAGEQFEVVFDTIDIDDFIKRYSSKRQWPAVLRFEIVIKDGEGRGASAVRARDLIIRTPPP